MTDRSWQKIAVGALAERPRDRAGGDDDDEPYHRQSEANPDLAPRPDQRWTGLLAG